MGRKRKLSQAEAANLQACLRENGSTCSDALVLKIWNKSSELRETGASAKKHDVQTLRQDICEPFLRCYQAHDLPAVKGEPVRFYLAKLGELLEYTVSKSTEWNRLLDEALKGDGGQVTCLLYHDEMTAGNILAPRKNQKACMLYASFVELHSSLHKENAWLCLGVLQHDEVERVAGGMSRLMALVSCELHSQQHLSGFPLTLASGRKVCKLRARSYFLSDADAQRSTWSVKGSSGLKPCLHCCNVISKGCLQHVRDPFCTITESQPCKFLKFADADYFEAAQKIQETHIKSRREDLEKTLGITHAAGGLLLDRTARLHLPPSSSCVDVLHVYFANGVASWEAAQMMEIIHEEGISVETLRDSASSSNWLVPGSRNKVAACYIRRLLDPRMFQDKTFKGQGRETWNLVLLLQYYVAELLENKRKDATDSFSLLHSICSELRRLKYRMMQIDDPCEL